MNEERINSAQQFWCASATTAAVCFLTPRPLRALMPLTIGYFVYRMARYGFPWAKCAPGDVECQWHDTEEYHEKHLGDAIDQSIDESFPASDPPSFSPGTAAPAN